MSTWSGRKRYAYGCLILGGMSTILTFSVLLRGCIGGMTDGSGRMSLDVRSLVIYHVEPVGDGWQDVKGVVNFSLDSNEVALLFGEVCPCVRPIITKGGYYSVATLGDGNAVPLVIGFYGGYFRFLGKHGGTYRFEANSLAFCYQKLWAGPDSVSKYFDRRSRDTAPK
jgi:hypothetical protein